MSLDKETLLGPPAPIRGLTRMTTARAQRGYRLSQFLCSLTQASCRQALQANEEAYMQACGLTEEEKAMVRRRDFVAMLDHGAATVAVGKASRVFGLTLVDLGALGRGQTAQDFIAERKRANEGKPWQF